MKSAPSSIFVLLLSNHRLIYCREMVGAPSVADFHSTSLHFLNKLHMQVVNHMVYDGLPETLKSKFKIDRKFSIARINTALKSHVAATQTIASITNEVLKIMPFPELRITPLSDELGIINYINQFDKIVDCFIKLSHKNNEFNSDDFWEQVSGKGEDTGADILEVKFHNKDGLKKATITTEIANATANGNSEVTLDGYDKSNARLYGGNDNFKLTKPIYELSTKVLNAAKTMVNAFNELIENSRIKLATPAENTSKALEKIKRKHNE